MNFDNPSAHPPSRSARSEVWTKRRAAIAVGCLLSFVLLALLGYHLATPRALATLIDFTGHPERDTAAELGQWRDAQRGDAFVDGDGARTPSQSDAHFRLQNGATLKMKPASQVRFARGGKGGSLRVDVELGQVEIQTGQQQVTIGSPFGDIRIQKNTGILLTRKDERLHIDVEFGAIQLGDRTVPQQHRVALEIGGLIIDLPPVPPDAPAVSTPPLQVPDAAEAPPEEAEAVPPVELAIGDGVGEAELTVAAGESFVVHDPHPPTAIGFSFAKVCVGAAELRAGKQVTQATHQGNLRLPPGKHDYEVRCLDQSDVVAARGRVRVLRDAGTRQLPAFAPTANVTTDGRQYTVMYQHHLPTVTVRWPTAPQAQSYTLTINGRTIPLQAPRHTFTSLTPGRHVIVFAAATDPVRQSRETVVEVMYDSQAPAARVVTPAAGFEAKEGATIEGQALPGWAVSVAGRGVSLDEQRQFRIQAPGGKAVPIAFTHPSRGTHYYIRRPKATP